MPTPSKTQVLLRVHAVALNPGGYKTIKYLPSIMVKKPAIPEMDVAGTIVSVGTDVQQWHPGDKVFGIIPASDMFRRRQGGLTEYALLQAENMYVFLLLNRTLMCRYSKPDFLSYEEASSIMVCALTAYQYLLKFPKVPLSRGQSIFINGGSGGVGLFAIQIARTIVGESGKIVASCSSRNMKLVQEAGANEVIDYKSVDLPQHLSQKYGSDRFDMVLDTVGSFDLYTASPKFLKDTSDFMPVAFELPNERRGILSVIANLVAALFLPKWLGGVPRRFTMNVTSANSRDIKEIGSLIERKEIKPVLDSIWAFDSDGIRGAYQKIMTGHAAGKVVVKIRD
jgi:NADPH:quinone reductase-like Zn-dependent oxidoreductase